MLNGVHASNDLKQTQQIARQFVKELLKQRKDAIIFLHGEMGSGKTTFVRYALEELGVDEHQFEGSPTFTVINEYQDGIYHVDLYRVASKEDIESTGLYELFEKKGIFFVEWPEILDIKPDISVRIEITGEHARRFVFSG